MMTPIEPIQMPRGFGGVAILWKNEINHLVTALNDGCERIQCVEITASSVNNKKLLIVSVYMPCKGYNTSTDDFLNVVDELNELYQKYSKTHEIIYAGDFNEDLLGVQNEKRAKYIRDFIIDSELAFSAKEVTFIHPNGSCSSIIDYFIYTLKNSDIINLQTLVDIDTNVSDHIPISLCIKCRKDELPKVSNVKVNNETRIKWDKLDKDQYQQSVESELRSVHTSGKLLGGDVSFAIENTLNILRTCAIQVSDPKHLKPKRNTKPKLKVWNEHMSTSLGNLRGAFKTWKCNGRRYDPEDVFFREMKECKAEFRRSTRTAIAKKLSEEKEEIMEARTTNTKLFHSLIKRQRGTGKNAINDLYVGDKHFSGQSNILEGFKTHFSSLAVEGGSDLYDNEIHELVTSECESIKHICKLKSVPTVTFSELDKAMKSVHKGKSPDVYGISIEHIIYGGEHLSNWLLFIINFIFETAEVPEILKKGVVSPVYKNKGVANESKNYRGITVLPVLCKLIEVIIRNRIQPAVRSSQNTTQRGFTAGASPLNSAYLLEEFYRETADNKTPAQVVLLDAKSAFDVVSHSHLLRRLYRIGVDDKHWTLIQSLHEDISSVVKLKGEYSESFNIYQGVRQGGILSTDLYKVYIDPLLAEFEHSEKGGHIGDVQCNNSACADDVSLMSQSIDDMQSLVNSAYEFSNRERYQLQPTKSVTLHLNKPKGINCPHEFCMNNIPLQNVNSAAHLGIKRTGSVKENIEINVDENIAKARRKLYSLMGAGLHGHGGHDHLTSLQLYRCYVLPVLTYGMELITPDKKGTEKMEIFQKRTLKHILSIPEKAPDSSVYILTGLLPIQAQLELQALNFFHNICSQSVGSLERKIFERQLAVKSLKSKSWATHICNLLFKYDLHDPQYYLSNDFCKTEWNQLVKKPVISFWKSKIELESQTYKSLKYLNKCFMYGKCHPILQVPCASHFEVTRLPARLRILAGTVTLQSTRVKFNQNEVDPRCVICSTESETIEHLLYKCPSLESVRAPILTDIRTTFHKINKASLLEDPAVRVKALIDCSAYVSYSPRSWKVFSEIEFHVRRLVHALLAQRLKLQKAVSNDIRR